MTLTRNPWWIAAGLIVLGGMLMAAAAAVRWLPCLGGSDQICLARQTLTFDYVIPVGPGEPLVVSAVLAAVGMFAVAASWPFIVGQLKIKRRLTLALLVVMMVKPILFGLLTLLAAATGGLPAGFAGPLFIGEIILDIAVLVVVLITPNDRLEDYQRLLLAAFPVWLVGSIGTVIDRVFFALTDQNAEVPPGSGVLSAALMVGCAIGIVMITRTAGPRRTPTVVGHQP
jgi:hypothetical protein